jgi:hypothetical protein
MISLKVLLFRSPLDRPEAASLSSLSSLIMLMIYPLRGTHRVSLRWTIGRPEGEPEGTSKCPKNFNERVSIGSWRRISPGGVAPWPQRKRT